MRAGYRARGHAAETNASRLKRRADVAEAIAALIVADSADAIQADERRLGHAVKLVRIRGMAS